jgi:hypothetical protein
MARILSPLGTVIESGARGQILSPHGAAIENAPTPDDAPPPISGTRIPPHGGGTGREGLPASLPQHLPQAPHPQITWS